METIRRPTVEVDFSIIAIEGSVVYHLPSRNKVGDTGFVIEITIHLLVMSLLNSEESNLWMKVAKIYIISSLTYASVALKYIPQYFEKCKTNLLINF